MMFERNDDAIAKLLKSDEVKAFETKIANVAAETTRRLVPSRDRENVKVVTTDEGVAVQVDSGLWAIWEFGSRNNPAYAPLRRGIEAAGLDIKKGGR